MAAPARRARPGGLTGFDEEVIFELGIERCLLTLTQAEGAFSAGPTIWKARDAWGTAGSDMVT